MSIYSTLWHLEDECWRCLSGKLLFAIHLGVVGSVDLRQLRKMGFRGPHHLHNWTLALQLILLLCLRAERQRVQGVPEVSQPHLVSIFGNWAGPALSVGLVAKEAGQKHSMWLLDGSLPQLHPTTDRLPADPSPRFGGRSVSRICCSWSHHLSCSLLHAATERLGVWGAIDHAYMGNNMGYLHV